MKKDKLLKRVELKNKLEYTLYPPIPKKNFLIEVTNACNSECIFCANRKMTRKLGHIDKNLLEKILYDAYREGVREVGFYTTGEPFLNKNLDDYVLMAKKIGFEYIYITTNGVLATIDRVKSLVENGLDSIKFSINAINRETYQFIHGKDDFDSVIRNLQEINTFRKTTNIKFKIFVSYIATRYSIEDKNVIEEFFEPMCDEVLVLNTVNQSGLTPEIKSFLKVEGEKTDIDFDIKLPCYMPFNAINVSHEGYLTACCADFQNYLAYADLNKDRLLDAWNNDTIVNLRKMHMNGDVQNTLCANCVYNTTSKPVPINEALATDFERDKMFDSKSVEDRVASFGKGKLY